MIQIEVTDEFDKWLKGLRDLQAKERIFERIRRLQRGQALITLLRGGDKSSQKEDIARAVAMLKRRNA